MILSSSHETRTIYLALLLSVWCVVGVGRLNASAGYSITIEPILTVSEEYTDNRFLSDEVKEHEFITIVTPGLLLEARSPRSEYSLLYELGYAHYERFAPDDPWRHHSLFSGHHEISKNTWFDMSNRFLVTEDPVTDYRVLGLIDGEEAPPGESPIGESPIVETETVRRNRASYLRDAAEISFTHQYSPHQDRFSLAYGFDILENRDPSIRDRYRHRPSLEWTHWLVPGRVGVEGGLVYSYEDVQTAGDDLGYTEERVLPIGYLTYWAIPNRLRFRTGLEYEYGEYTGDSDDTFPFDSDTNRYRRLSPMLEISWLNRRTDYRLDLLAEYEKGENDFEDGAARPEENFESGFGRMRFTHIFNRLLKGFVLYEYGIMDYKAEEIEDYSTHMPGVGVEYLLGGETPVIFSFGYLFRDTDAGGTETGWIVNGHLPRWRFAKDGYFSLRAESGYTADNAGAERLGFGLYYNIDTAVHYAFTREWMGNVYALYQKNEYTDFEDQRDDTTYEIGGGIDYLPFDWLKFQLDYHYREVDSTLEADDYTENRILIQMVLRSPRPYPL
jgi:hypothetical protein